MKGAVPVENTGATEDTGLRSADTAGSVGLGNAAGGEGGGVPVKNDVADASKAMMQTTRTVITMMNYP